MMRLVTPSVRYQKSYIEAVRERQAEIHEGVIHILSHRHPSFSHFLNWLSRHFPEYLDLLASDRQTGHITHRHTPYYQYWFIENQEFLGAILIRPHLHPTPVESTGHIGYYIRPSKRDQGYGTRLLAVALKKASRLGIDPILVTCLPNNVISAKVILANGGHFDLKLSSPTKHCYWFSFTQTPPGTPSGPAAR